MNIPQLMEFVKKNRNTFLAAAGIIVVLVIVSTLYYEDKQKTEESTSIASGTEEPRVETVVSDEPLVGWLSTYVSSSPDSNPASPKHGTFSISFGIMASNKADLYFTPTCGTSSTNGVTFSVWRDGIILADSNLSKESCTILSAEGLEKTASGSYVIKSGTQTIFQLIVVTHPDLSGSYQVGITHVRYGAADKKTTTEFHIDPGTLTKLKTEPLAL